MSHIEQELGEAFKRNASKHLGEHIGIVVRGIDLDSVDDTLVLFLANGKLPARYVASFRTAGEVARERVNSGVIHMKLDRRKLRVMYFVS